MRYDGNAEEAEAREIGVRAIARGEIAVLLLNGGLATRFGGVVKGTVEVFDNTSFIGINISDVVQTQQLFNATIPIVVMNSFATSRDTAQHLALHDHFGMPRGDLLFFDQSVSIRLTTRGEVFIGKNGKGKYYAPGHGEFFQRIHLSGVYDLLLRRGVRHIAFSNIDNLGASLDPLLIGYHVKSRRDMTVEVVAKTRNVLGEWDVGGAPVSIGNRTQIVEGFRLPRTLPAETLPDFQTNNMYFSMDALALPPTVPRYLVVKQVDGQATLSFESVTCEATGVLRPDGMPWFSLNIVRVPRWGPRGRFYPVKSREDLSESRDAIKSRVIEGWATRAREYRR